MNKPREIAEKLKKGKLLESDLLEYETKGNTNVIKFRVRRLLGFGKRLIVKNGYWMIQRTGGVAGLIIMAILVVVMSILSYNIGKPNTIDACLEQFDLIDIRING